MSSIAVFMVLGGSAYAAATLPKNSVGSKQIKSNAVTSSKVKDGSLLSKDFKAGQLPAGAKGDTGATGAQGPKGDTGLKGDKGDKGDPGATNVTAVQGSDVTIAPGNKAFASATCPTGSVATGGGGVNVNTSGVNLLQSFPDLGTNPTSWNVSYQNTSAGSVTVHARVVCASP